MQKLFGTNGVRGVVNEGMSVQLASNLGLAVGTYLATKVNGTPRVHIGTDTRTSNQMLKSAVGAGLLATGIDVFDAGIVPTPALQYSVKNSPFDLGIIITASHNPPEFNGIKCVDSDGTELAREKEEEIERIYFSEDFSYSTWDRIGKMRGSTEVIPRYIDGVLGQVDAEAIRNKGIKVVLDCANGAGSLCTPYILQKLGCDLVTLNCQQDGAFPGHESEPVPANLQDLILAVKESSADIGIAHDGDADRTIFIDDKGNYVYGDKALAVVSGEMVKENGGGLVVTPVSSSSCVEEVVKRNGGEILYTKVGSPIVARKMIETNALFGGEENGGFIFPKHQYCRDAAMTAAKMLDILARSGKNLSEHIAEVPDYYLLKAKVPCPDEKKVKALEVLVDAMKDREVNTLDGVKITYDEGWVLIRPSGTEPIYRIFVEARTREKAEALAQENKKQIEEIISRV